MQNPIRLSATAGVSVVVAGVIAATPAVAPRSGLAEAADAVVRLTASGVVTDALTNLTQLYDNFAIAPLAGVQQAVANEIGYVRDLLAGTTTPGEISAEIGDNLQKVIAAVTLDGVGEDDYDTVISHTVDTAHAGLLSEISDYLATSVSPGLDDLISDALYYAVSPLWGIIYGEAGVVISPFVPYINPFLDILGDLATGQTPDWAGALQDLGNAHSEVLGALLNGATANYDVLVPLINSLGILPPGVELTSLSFTYGGLLTPGDVEAGPYPVGAGDSAGSVVASGGSVFNGLGFGFDDNGSQVDITGQGIGPIGAVEGMSQAIAGVLGWDSGTDPVTPPLDGIQLPVVGDLAGDAGNDAVSLADQSDGLFGWL